MLCPYCNKPSELVTGKVIYRNRPDLYGKYYYYCKDCNAYTGCHKNTKEPLGTLANADLRKARVKAHDALDKIWKEKLLNRRKVYEMLSNYMELHKKETHIGLFDEYQCAVTIVFARRFYKELLMRKEL